LEHGEVNALFEFLAMEFIPFEERKRWVVAEITQHLTKLETFSQTFGHREWRKGIVAGSS